MLIKVNSFSKFGGNKLQSCVEREIISSLEVICHISGLFSLLLHAAMRPASEDASGSSGQSAARVVIRKKKLKTRKEH